MTAKTKREVVIVPGWGYLTEKWEPLLKDMRDEGWQVTFLDVPGLTGEELKKAWTLENYVDWLEEKLKGKNELMLIGHSNGGRVIVKYLATKQDKRVQKVVLIGSAGLIDKRWWKRLKKAGWEKVARWGKKLTGESVFWRKLMYRVVREHDYERANEVMKKTMVNLIKEDLSEELEKLGRETTESVDSGAGKFLLIWGENDGQTPLFQGRAMKEKLGEQAKLVIVEEARHSPQFTHEKQVWQSIKEFATT